jgi:ABC-type Mn2+/Zn2+ transport system permease subunit
VVAVLLLLVLRARLARLTESAGRSVLIIAWAIGEAAALFGGVYYFLSGEPQWFIIGLFLMLASFILFPIRRT